tara:strand:- start:3204 stop:5828 length:2625 start_codon:yes stop_codon:yes gene_type:complete
LTTKLNMRVALRLALWAGVSTLGIMAEAPAIAQETPEQSVSLLRFGQEVSQAGEVVSESKDVMMARRRVNGRSLLIFDAQNGVAIAERAGGIGIMPLLNKTGPEASYAFDYVNNIASGSDAAASNFNTIVHPLLISSPPLDGDADWSVTTNLHSLGLQQDPAAVSFKLSRRYLDNQGAPIALIEFDIPAFTYRLPNGDTIVHWAHGFAASDPGFGQIHALATQHRISNMAPDGTMRPVSISTSLHGIDRNGGWRMQFGKSPEVLAAIDRVMATRGGKFATTESASGRSNGAVSFNDVAARLDFVAFGMMENSPNGIGLALSTARDIADSAAKEKSWKIITENEVADTDSASESDKLADINKKITEGLSNLTNDIVKVMAPDLPDLSGLNEALAGIDFENPYTAEEIEQRAQSLRNSNINEVGEANSPIFIYTDEQIAIINQYNAAIGAPLLTDKDKIPVQASHGDILSIALERKYLDHQPTPEELKQFADQVRAQQENKLRGFPMRLISMMVRDLQDDYQAFGDRTAAELDALVSQIAASSAAELSAEQKKNAEAAAALAVVQFMKDASVKKGDGPRLQDAGVGDGVSPDWLVDEMSPIDESERRAQYDQLLKDLLSELDQTRTAQEAVDKKRADSGADSLDSFVANNAFTYSSMVGIVPTSLSRWSEWLATQNVRELERLALTAGYPNLASALSDSSNILRQSQDEGYRQWALQAPSCGGYVGCGPSYLERWHMKTSIVALGDILSSSRDIFSTGGFSDIGISGLNLSYLLRDNALEDGDIVRVRITQFGRTIYEGEISLTNIGNLFNLGLGRGVASLEIFAVNEGTASPNTAQISVDNVVRGQGTQSYSLRTGETATLRIEAGATASAGGPQ